MQFNGTTILVLIHTSCNYIHKFTVCLPVSILCWLNGREPIRITSVNIHLDEPLQLLRICPKKQTAKQQNVKNNESMEEKYNFSLQMCTYSLGDGPLLLEVDYSHEICIGSDHTVHL